MTSDIRTLAARALEQLLQAGFTDAHVGVSASTQTELNLAHNQPSLLRSTEDHNISLLGIVDGRKASTALSDLDDAALASSIRDLLERARMAPQDSANAVSQGQSGHFAQGPMQPDLDLLADKAQELLDFRARETPRMHIEEGLVAHEAYEHVLLTSGGTDLSSAVGSYDLMAMGTASDGGRSSSLNDSGGTANDISGAHACDLFGIGDMMRETERQMVTESFGGNATGDVVLAPTAVADLLGWLLDQLHDFALIADASLYKDSVGAQIASPLLTVRSRFDAPGHAAYTGDGFVAAPLQLVQAGKLNCLLPSLYGSRKTGIKHTPAASGWAIDPGAVPRAAMADGISKGALVKRFSMGEPAANGDFSGVIKSSFRIDQGRIGPALSETMVSGNMAQMLRDIVAVSQEHLDLGSQDFPWIRVSGLHFS